MCGPNTVAVQEGRVRKPCRHKFCHRDDVEVDKPIGLPWASGYLLHLPGQGPKSAKSRKRQLYNKCLDLREEEIKELQQACPVDEDKNKLVNESQKDEIIDEVTHLFNFVMEAGNVDVAEYLKEFKEREMKDDKKEDEGDKDDKSVKGGEEDEEEAEAVPEVVEEEVIAEEEAPPEEEAVTESEDEED